jgi:hypothetical protein
VTLTTHQLWTEVKGALPLLPLCVLMTGCRVNCTLCWFGLLVARKEAETCSVDYVVPVHYVRSDATFVVDSTAYGIVCHSVTVVMPVYLQACGLLGIESSEAEVSIAG